ncbi:unnamed protein product, partial [Ectocarpus sp. 12 AP-2014]
MYANRACFTYTRGVADAGHDSTRRAGLTRSAWTKRVLCHSGLDVCFAPNAQQYVLSCPEESRIICCTPGERKTVNLQQDTFPSGTRPRVARSLRARERPPRCGWTSVWNRDIG